MHAGPNCPNVPKSADSSAQPQEIVLHLYKKIKTMHHKFFVSAAFALFLFSACEKNDEENSVEIGANDPFSLVYLKGSAWTDYSYRVDLNQNGRLLTDAYIGIGNDHRQMEYLISDDTLALVQERITEAAKIHFKSNYGFGPENPYDLPVTFIKYQMGIHSDSTVIYYPANKELPKELESLKALIEEILSNK